MLKRACRSISVRLRSYIIKLYCSLTAPQVFLPLPTPLQVRQPAPQHCCLSRLNQSAKKAMKTQSSPKYPRGYASQPTPRSPLLPRASLSQVYRQTSQKWLCLPKYSLYRSIRSIQRIQRDPARQLLCSCPAPLRPRAEYPIPHKSRGR